MGIKISRKCVNCTNISGECLVKDEFTGRYQIARFCTKNIPEQHGMTGKYGRITPDTEFASCTSFSRA